MGNVAAGTAAPLAATAPLATTHAQTKRREATTARKLVMGIVEARNLLPKDGTGTSSPYARVDFDEQRRKTRTVAWDLNPAWNEPLEFSFPGSGAAVDPVAGELLEVAVLHDMRVGPSRRSNFLGRVCLDSRQFVRMGKEALIYFPLEKKSFFSWVCGDIGLRVYYVDEPIAPSKPEPDPDPPTSEPAADAAAVEAAKDAAPDIPPASVEPPPTPTKEPLTPAAAPAVDEAGTEKPPEADTAAATPVPDDAAVMTSEAAPASSTEAAGRSHQKRSRNGPNRRLRCPRICRGRCRCRRVRRR